jgi:hypothetical protein
MLLRGGWPKFILREAMANKLPEEVRWGRGKPHIGWLYNKTFLQREQSRGKLSLELLQGAIGGYVEPQKLQSAWQEYVSGGNYEAIHSVYVLSRWLEQNVNRIVEKKQGVR